MPASCVYEGVIRHRRHRPVRHELRYPIALLFLDLDELPEVLDGRLLWSARRPAFGRFRRADYLGDPRRPLAGEVRALVRSHTGTAPGGPIRLLTHARTFGHCFNPVSFYFCYDAAGESVETVVAEVTNTPWGERHAYVLPGGAEGRVHEGRFDKEFHVSPFMAMDHRYHWRIVEPGAQLAVHIDSIHDGRRTFDATLTLRRHELGPRMLRRLLWRYPAATLVAGARIYTHALRLKLKGAPYFRHPERAR